MSARSIGWLVVAAIVVAVRPSPVRACSCDFYRPGNYYVGADGRLPRDAPGIPWNGTDRLLFLEDPPRPLSTRVSLRRTVDGRSEVVPFTVVERGKVDIIVPDGGLRVGDTYTVMVREYWNDSPLRRSYSPRKYWSKWQRRAYAKPPELHDMLEVAVTVRDEPMDLRGAELQLAPRVRETVPVIDQRRASCFEDHLADTIAVTVVLPPALEPYRDYFLYETRVDGQVFAPRGNKCSSLPAGRSWTKRPGTDRVFSECDEQVEGLTPGDHRVTVTISTPDGARSFVTPERTFAIGCDVPEASESPPVASAEAPVERPAEPPVAPQGPPPAAARGCGIGAPPWGWPLALLFIRRRRGGPGDARTPRPRG